MSSDDGDLTKVLDIASGDELEVIGSSLNRLLEKTGNTVREIKGGTDSIETKMGLLRFYFALNISVKCDSICLNDSLCYHFKDD